MKNKLLIIVFIAVISVLFLGFINNSYALTETEVEKLKPGDEVKVTKDSEYYQVVSEEHGNDIVKKEGVIKKGTVITLKNAGKSKDWVRADVIGTVGIKRGMKLGAGKQENIKFYVCARKEDKERIVPIENVEIVKVSKEEQEEINNKVKEFLNRENVKKMFDGKLKGKELGELWVEAHVLEQETNDEDLNKKLIKLDDELLRKGYTMPSNVTGGWKLVSPEGDILGEYEGDEKSTETIYKNPFNKGNGNDSSEEKLSDMITDADSFVNSGETINNQEGLQKFSKTFYNIMLEIGTAVAVIVGMIIGIKFMTSSVEGKAEIKQLLIPYIVGCVVVFGGFGIWALVVNILQRI